MPLSCRVAIALATVLALGASASVFADGNATRGKILSYTCLGCHGIEDYRNAYPDYTVPRLGGQHADYIVAALKEYAADTRTHVTMHVQASTLSDQDMQDVAAYFSSETDIKSGAQTVGTPPAKVTQLCVSCHGKDGVGISGAYPTLKDQHADYLEQALEEYKSGERKNPVMSTFVVGLTAQDISAIAEYYSAQSPGLKTLDRRLTFLSAK
ncbi:MAG TPA: cytochrome c [Steroidobacteraceae bacterium]|jgi:cytochrome c553|nr:cytochrome c [Steroidobacteraceae bacterium]